MNRITLHSHQSVVVYDGAWTGDSLIFGGIGGFGGTGGSAEIRRERRAVRGADHRPGDEHHCDYLAPGRIAGHPHTLRAGRNWTTSPPTSTCPESPEGKNVASMKPDVFDHRDRSLVPPGVRRPADTLRDVLRRVDDTGLDRPPNGFGDRAPIRSIVSTGR